MFQLWNFGLILLCRLRFDLYDEQSGCYMLEETSYREDLLQRFLGFANRRGLHESPEKDRDFRASVRRCFVLIFLFIVIFSTTSKTFFLVEKVLVHVFSMVTKTCILLWEGILRGTSLIEYFIMELVSERENRGFQEYGTIKELSPLHASEAGSKLLNNSAVENKKKEKKKQVI